MFIWLGLKEQTIPCVTLEFPLLRGHSLPLHLSCNTWQRHSWESQNKNRMSLKFWPNDLRFQIMNRDMFELGGTSSHLVQLAGLTTQRSALAKVNIGHECT